MLTNWLLTNCQIVNEGSIGSGDVRIKDGRIEAIGHLSAREDETVIDAAGRWLLPGLIDDQVHFRQPGLTHKAEIASESRAAVAGGITSYMDMPNVQPPTLSMARLEEKRTIAATHSLANYAFYLGAANDNVDTIAAANPCRIAGIKIFMGSSTGNLLVDDESTLEKIFKVAPTLIATHCENNQRVNDRLAMAKKRYGDDIPASAHASIRDDIACFQSSSMAVNLARKTGARLHILHISTARELALFEVSGTDKAITAEACIHHLLFDEADYSALGMRLKCNPAVKTRTDRDAIRAAVADGRIDVLATDHAPHLLSEKELPYATAAAGLPLVEYALPAFLELVATGTLTIERVAQATAHRVADIFAIRDRGYIREGYYADLVLVEASPSGYPLRSEILSRCGWTPFTDYAFRHRVWMTFVNGNCVWQHNTINDSSRGMALDFNR